jgi:hypothetical protein
MNECHILIRLLLMYIKRNWEFGSGLAKLQNFWGICTPKPPRSGHHCSWPSFVAYVVPRLSVQVGAFVGKCFLTNIGFHSEEPPSWKTSPCRLSATAYSIHSQLTSILQTIFLSATWRRAMRTNEYGCTNIFVLRLQKRLSNTKWVT